MEKVFIRLLLATLLLSTVSLVTACHDHEEETVTKGNFGTEEKTDSSSCNFTLTNLRTKEWLGTKDTIQENGGISQTNNDGILNCQKGDTLIVSCSPKKKYEEFSFTTEYLLDGDKVGEEIHTGSLATGIHTITASAKCEAEGYKLSATRSFTISLSEIEKVSDSNAGRFTLVNISAGEEIDKGYHECFVGDTIKAIFEPKDEYANLPFSIEAGPFAKLNDSLFVVTDLQTNIIGQNVWFRAEYKDDRRTLSAEKTVSFFTYVEEAYVTYRLGISEDLMQFVDVTLEYTDERGHIGKKEIGQEDWTIEADTLYEYVDAKGQKMLTGNKNPGAEWTKVGEEYYRSIFYTLDIHYEKLDCEYTVTAKYTARQNVQLSKDSYEFRHYLSYGPAVVAGNRTISISISNGGDDDIERSKVEEYLNNLCATPDKITLYLDKRKRSVNERK